MARRSSVIRVSVIGDATKLNQAFDDAQRRTQSFTEKMDRMGRTLTNRVSLPLAAAGGFAIKMASDLEQSAGAVESVFGPASDTIREFGETAAESFGLSRREVNETAAILGAQLQSMGFSAEDAAEQVVGLQERAADMAATFGGTTREALDAIGSLMRGERDPIEQYGVAIKQADINARLAADGLSNLEGEAKKQAEAQAALALLFGQTADITGQFAREADTTAGALARMRAQSENLSAELGTKLLPVANDMLDSAGGLLDTFSAMPEPVKSLTVQVGLLGVAAGPVMRAFSLLASPLGMVAAAATAAATAGFKLQEEFGDLGGAAGNLLGPMGGLAGFIEDLKEVAGFLGIELEETAKQTDTATDSTHELTRVTREAIEMASRYGQLTQENVENMGEFGDVTVVTADQMELWRRKAQQFGDEAHRAADALRRNIDNQNELNDNAQRFVEDVGEMEEALRMLGFGAGVAADEILRAKAAAEAMPDLTVNVGGVNVRTRATPRAHGGPLAAGELALVGEKGPELFVPSQSGTVMPNHALGGTIVLQVGDREMARWLLDATGLSSTRRAVRTA